MSLKSIFKRKDPLKESFVKASLVKGCYFFFFVSFFSDIPQGSGKFIIRSDNWIYKKNLTDIRFCLLIYYAKHP